MTHPANCLNCFAELKEHDKFCYNCGQSALHTHKRITMSHITHEVIHALTHADKGFFYLIKELATQPGLTIREYLAGKHKKYFNPFSFFFIVLGIYVLSNSVLKPFHPAVTSYSPTSQTGQVQYPKEIKTPKQRAKYDKIQTRVSKAMNFFNTKTNIVLCISTPFIAFIMFLIYRRQLFYAEHLVVITFTNTFLNLLSILIFTPLLYIFKDSAISNLLMALMMLAHIIYLSIVYYSVLDRAKTVKNYLKCLGSSFVAILAWGILSMLVVGGYITYGILF
ncbi:uncharacterized protein DUF3667 [Mucilaginibacter auburnensis]|uniref:Uncharacterized protein DUF3667 n=2 Tax=Mucilaginibacter auburnensis TaxID=1457233 RepID=A0A2H9VQQ2_9SPHI|nr:uncharacterized protein DUF3667 [Mucilaginibacter auburnensis]